MPTRDIALNQHQKKLIAEKVAHDDLDVWGHAYDEDKLTYKMLRPLMFQVYALNLDGRAMTKYQAARFVPARHSKTCKKYIETAQRLGYIDLQQHQQDKRKWLVRPTSHLISAVEKEIADEANRWNGLLNFDSEPVEAPSQALRQSRMMSRPGSSKSRLRSGKLRKPKR